MEPVNILDARNSLSRLITAAERGDDVVIARRGQPVVRLVAIHDQPTNTGAALATWFDAHPRTPTRTVSDIDEQIAESREAGW